ncbi:TPA: glycosyltransferase [Vibrio vulnificus]
MKKFLFDLIATQPSPEAKFHGGSEYAKQIFHSLSNYVGMECIYDDSLPLDKGIKAVIEEKKIKLHIVRSNLDLEKLLLNTDVLGFYSAIPYRYGMLKTYEKKIVMTIHGIRDIECYGDETEIKYRNKIISKVKLNVKNILFSGKRKRNAAKDNILNLISKNNISIITDSEHSKYSLITNFPFLSEEKINAHPCPIELNDREFNFEKSEEYFLLVSANRWIKNNYRAIKALDNLISKKLIDKQVIVLGSSGAGLEKYVLNKNNFSFLDYVSHEELEQYFFNAYCFIYPTLNEGYGYPPIQAMQFRTPVIASACTSVPEVCQDAALYFNPLSIEELEVRILNLYRSESLRNKLRLNGEKRVEYLKQQNSKYLENIKEFILCEFDII